jgi:hypothetical protein
MRCKTKNYMVYIGEYTYGIKLMTINKTLMGSDIVNNQD